MKFSWKRLVVAVGGVTLVFAHVLVAFYLCANIIDWKIDFLGINPSEPHSERHFPVMTYPPSNGSGFQIGDPSNTIIFEDFYLRYNGSTPVENQPLELSVIGTLAPSFAEKIHSVSFYFDGALPYPVGSGTYTGGWGISLYPTTNHQSNAISLGAFIWGTPVVINWQVQGDYYPSITINYGNFTHITQSYLDCQNFRIHIDSTDVLRQQSSNRINTSISIAMAFFGFVDGSIVVGHLLRRKTENDDGKQPTKEPKSKPNKDQPNQKELRDKSKTPKHGKNQRETNKVRTKKDEPKS